MEKRHDWRSAWGENDQIGAMNHVTPEMLVRLSQGVKKGTVTGGWSVWASSSPRPSSRAG